MTDGHFAIRVLRGEEYFVVIENLPVETASAVDPRNVIRRIAELADGAGRSALAGPRPVLSGDPLGTVPVLAARSSLR